MSFVRVIEGIPPYAYLDGEYEQRVYLGLLPGEGSKTDMNIARLQGVAPYAHNAFELTLGFIARSAYRYEKIDRARVALATLASNNHLFKSLQHPHELANDLQLKDGVIERNDEVLPHVIAATLWTAKVISRIPGLYGNLNQSANFIFALSHFRDMLQSGGFKYSDANYMIDDQGNLIQR